MVALKMIRVRFFLLILAILAIFIGLVVLVPTRDLANVSSILLAVIIGASSFLSPLLFLSPIPETRLSPSLLTFLAVLAFVLVLPVGFFLVLVAGLSCLFGCQSPFGVSLLFLVVPMIVAGFRLLQMARRNKSLLNTSTPEAISSPKAAHPATLFTYALGGFVVLLILVFLVLFILGVNI